MLYIDNQDCSTGSTKTSHHNGLVERFNGDYHTHCPNTISDHTTAQRPVQTHTHLQMEETSSAQPVSAEDVRYSDGTLTIGPMTAVCISHTEKAHGRFLIQ